MKKLVVLLLFLITSLGISAQDFQCQLSINSQKISSSNREKFNSLQQELIKFINERKLLITQKEYYENHCFFIT